MPLRYILGRRMWAAVVRGWRRVTRPSPLWPRVGRRLGLGHRGAFLVGFGLIYFALAFSVVLSPAPPDPLLLHTLLPPVVRMLLWSGCGAIAIAIARDPRWQWIGFVALSLPPTERAMSYGAGVVLDAVTTPGFAPWPYLAMLLLYVGVLFTTRLISSWPDPPTDAPPKDQR